MKRSGPIARRTPLGWGKPRTPIARGERLSRNAPVKRRNAERRASEFARAYGSSERVEWIRAQPCVGTADPFHECQGPIDNMHVVGGGAGRKADASAIVPACRTLHRWAHREGIATVARIMALDFDALAAQTERRWQEYVGR